MCKTETDFPLKTTIDLNHFYRDLYEFPPTTTNATKLGLILCRVIVDLLSHQRAGDRSVMLRTSTTVRHNRTGGACTAPHCRFALETDDGNMHNSPDSVLRMMKSSDNKERTLESCMISVSLLQGMGGFTTYDY